MLAKYTLPEVTSQPPVAQEPDFLSRRVEAYYRERAVNPVVGGHPLKGRIPGPGDTLLVSNDYLSLSRHPDIVAVQATALQAQGHGVLRSSVFGLGDTPQHRLERDLARHGHSGDALLTQSGWCANTGLLAAIADAHTPVYLDMFAHMSLWEGVQSAGATPRPFRHNSVESLQRLAAKYGPGVVIVDAVYSTNGDVCPLAEMVHVATAAGCVIVVDESHSLGVYGREGEGLVAHLGLDPLVHFRTSSLSKAFAARGGVILGSARNIEYLRYQSRPAIFSSGLLPPEIAGLQATVQVIRREHYRREKVMQNAAYLRHALAALGYEVGTDESQILALVPGPEHQTMRLRDALEARGVFGSVFCDPATPRNRSLIRFTINAGHTREALDHVAAVCGQVRAEVNVAAWPQSRGHAAGTC
ncbi:MAG: quorum-sensing autoinducer CAI-1 synthase [Candidatus Lambdaproteobacteria bacterium]|nr:quorum-sensing autoinducer CAI-1 synthase [Candidatus Lambdaproteobacteria bacterium]